MVETLLQNFGKLNVRKNKDERSPHKPLLALWAIGQCLQGRNRLIEYDSVHRALLVLLQTFDRPRSAYKPQEPFWRMQKDQVWEVTQADRVPVLRGSVSPTNLRRFNVLGGFPSSLYDTFRRDPNVAFEVAHQLVEAHFPESMHSAVLEMTLGEYAFHEWSLDSKTKKVKRSPLLTSAYSRRYRNPKFRKQVLEKYDYRCAVCGYNFEFPAGHWPALEAAHIRWHSHDGPDESKNGLSLCALHHEFFDWGFFTVQPGTLNILVTKTVLERVPNNPITDFHGMQLGTIPRRNSDRPAVNHLNWHTKNVFRDV